ncbi:uncharacterized protein LOC128318861 [Pangasianodon hypophthalmus]|uniref:uncharacterized protein LOC128318861 n=1 Tax=Pangasianodon hypophthalmus TaxID=310915 RepID=UPI00230818D2|nr:uncharacterized protein LOC128318861 [Pangasianodon hypophthalmus]
MKRIGFICLLLCVSVHIANSVKKSCREKNICVLKCGKETNGNVTWSRDVDGKREKILTIYKETVIKHITDPDRRYSSGAGLILSIFKFSPSDAGRYYCNENTVELSVISNSEIISQERTRTGELLLAAAVAGGCVLALASVLVMWKCFSKRKGSAAKTEEDSAEKAGSLDTIHTYESIYETPSAPQPGNQQIPKDGIYYLASHSGIQITR